MTASNQRLVLLNTVSYLAVLAVNFLSNSLPLNGRTPAEISDQYPNLFVPAGITFSIWGIIYLWLLGLIIYQVIGRGSYNTGLKIEQLVEKSSWFFWVSCALNIMWLLTWHWDMPLLSVVVMSLLMSILVVLNGRAGVGYNAAYPIEKWLAHLPYGIYQGWISIALIANITAGLVSVDWNGWGLNEPAWAVIMITAGTVVASWMVKAQNNLGHGLAAAWGLYGIYLKRHAAGDAPEVAIAALIGMGVVVLVTAMNGRRLVSY